jgi:mannose-6-phosphate isomerase-like protein (cupin superfamily)
VRTHRAGTEADMSYPPDRYHGEHGEVSATFRRAEDEPDLRIGPISAVSYLATGATTSGEFGLYRWDMSAIPAGPAPHFHRTISESFFVLSGNVRIFDGEQWIDAKAGDFAYVPAGGIHAFRNESGEPASMLLLFAPGAPREPYFEALAQAAAAGRAMAPDELATLYRQHDNHML